MSLLIILRRSHQYAFTYILSRVPAVEGAYGLQLSLDALLIMHT